MNVTPVEVEALKAQIAAMSVKMDIMADSISNIEKILAKQEGQALALRLYAVENKVQAVEKLNAELSWIPEAVDTHTKDMGRLSKFQYLVTGGLIVANVAISLVIKFWEKIF
jgi:hypothetical protein